MSQSYTHTNTNRRNKRFILLKQLETFCYGRVIWVSHWYEAMDAQIGTGLLFQWRCRWWWRSYGAVLCVRERSARVTIKVIDNVVNICSGTVDSAACLYTLYFARFKWLIVCVSVCASSHSPLCDNCSECIWTRGCRFIWHLLCEMIECALKCVCAVFERLNGTAKWLETVFLYRCIRSAGGLKVSEHMKFDLGRHNLCYVFLLPCLCVTWWLQLKRMSMDLCKLYAWSIYWPRSMSVCLRSDACVFV